MFLLNMQLKFGSPGLPKSVKSGEKSRDSTKDITHRWPTILEDGIKASLKSSHS